MELQQIEVPRSFEAALEGGDVQAALADIMAWLINDDGVITIDEFLAMALTSERLGSVVGNALHLETRTLHVLADGEPEPPSKEQKKLLAAQNATLRGQMFDAYLPVLRCQGQEARPLAKKLAKILDVDDYDARLEALPEAKESGLFGSIAKIFSEKEDGTVARAQRLAGILPSSTALKTALSDELKGTELEAAISAAIVETRETADELLPGADDLKRQRETSKALERLCMVLVKLVEDRLRAVNRRIEHERSLFQEDLENFISHEVDRAKLSMRDLADDGENFSSVEVWERWSREFGSSAASAFEKKVAKRYQAHVDLWQRELSDFQSDLQQTKQSVFDTVGQDAFVGLIRTDFASERAAEMLDKASGYAVAAGAATVGAAGVAGVAYGGAIMSAAATLLASPAAPVVLGVAGVVGVGLIGAAAWNHFGSADKRKKAIIKDQAEAIRAGLKELLEPKSQELENAYDGIKAAFKTAAETEYAPMIRAALLLSRRASLMQTVIARVVADSSKLLDVIDN
jgi:uncharacterized tellurite resistance protein B-like protein